MKRLFYLGCAACLLALAVWSGAAEQEPAPWITDEEAALPDKKNADNPRPSGGEPVDLPAAAARKAMAGPIIFVEAPDENRPYNGRIDIHIRFEKNPTGEPVDMRSLKVIYLKLFDIDITGRVRPYIKENAIDATRIKFPKGNHKVKIQIKDREQMESSRVIRIKVRG